MNTLRTYLIILAAAAYLAACASNQYYPLVFGQSHTVGISIGAGASEQGADFVLGYKDKNIAVVPIAIQVSEGEFGQVGSTSGEGFEDSFSVLGQFEVSTSTQDSNVGLGKFFATGAAAKALADGFSCEMAGEGACTFDYSEGGKEIEDE